MLFLLYVAAMTVIGRLLADIVTTFADHRERQAHRRALLDEPFVELAYYTVREEPVDSSWGVCQVDTIVSAGPEYGTIMASDCAGLDGHSICWHSTNEEMLECPNYSPRNVEWLPMEDHDYPSYFEMTAEEEALHEEYCLSVAMCPQTPLQRASQLALEVDEGLRAHQEAQNQARIEGIEGEYLRQRTTLLDCIPF